MTKPKIRILIVEDDLVDRMACRRALTQNPDFEFELFEAETSREGLQLAQTQSPDCVLLDYHLPDLIGLEFLAELKNDLGELPVPVIMLTGTDNVSVAVEALKRGAQDYLVKDAHRQYLELLPSVIMRVLRERQTLLEKRLAEENLVKAEAKYRSLVEQIPTITYTTAPDVSGKLLYISPQIQHQLGFSPEELQADTEGFLRQLHPNDRALVHAEITRSYETGEPLRCEYRLLARDGEVRWFLNEASLVRHESGEPLFMQGVLIDITNDKKVEAELLQHRRRLEELVAHRTMQFEKRIALLESANSNLVDKLGENTLAGDVLKKRAAQLEDLYQNAPCGYFTLDTDEVIIQVNDTWLQWLGCTREEVEGKPRLTDLLTPASQKSFLESYRQLKEGGWIVGLALEIARKDGTRLSVLLNANTIRDASGRFVMSRAIVFDITEPDLNK